MHTACATTASCGARPSPDPSSRPLLRCSRCRAVAYCSAACARRYWPSHRPACRPNEFADALEPHDPNFAAWLRDHGRQANLRDDQIDRLERAGRTGTRADVQEQMYGRFEPTPQPPSYSSEDIARMEARRRADAAAARQLALTAAVPAQAAWDAIVVPEGLGAADVRRGVKWRQNLSHVEIFVRLSEPVGGASAGKLSVSVDAERLSVRRERAPAAAAADKGTATKSESVRVLEGSLCRAVVPQSCVWSAEGHLLEIVLQKRSRKGFYLPGETNADTFWPWLLRADSESDGHVTADSDSCEECHLALPAPTDHVHDEKEVRVPRAQLQEDGAGAAGESDECIAIAAGKGQERGLRLRLQEADAEVQLQAAAQRGGEEEGAGRQGTVVGAIGLRYAPTAYYMLEAGEPEL